MRAALPSPASASAFAKASAGRNPPSPRLRRTRFSLAASSPPLRPGSFWNLARPSDDPLFQLRVRQLRLAGADAAAHRDAGRMHGFGIAGDERVPPVKIAAVGDEAVGAGRRQPGDVAYALRRQLHAILDEPRAIGII